MKIKLSRANPIDISTIKALHSTPKKMLSGLNTTIKPHYYIEFNSGTYMVISKQEYKMLRRVMNNGHL